MKLTVPEVLKVQLVDDWEAVTKNNQVCWKPYSHHVVVADFIVCPHFSNQSISIHNLHSLFLFLANQTCLKSYKNSKTMSLKWVNRRGTPFMRRCATACLSRTHSLRDPELILPTIISGLQVYFDRSLGANLLYRFERPQYAEIRKTYVTGPKVIVGQEKDMSAIYGAEHLLRMLGDLIFSVIYRKEQLLTYPVFFSEPTSNDSQLHDGCGECGVGEGLCERAACVWLSFVSEFWYLTIARIVSLYMSVTDCSFRSTRVQVCSTRIYLDHNFICYSLITAPFVTAAQPHYSSKINRSCTHSCGYCESLWRRWLQS